MSTPNINLEPILKKYIDKKLFSQEQNQFKEEFFNELFNPYDVVDYSRRTTIFINAILEEENLPYVFLIKTEYSGKNKGKKYWILDCL
jgi:hypothetical protein